MYNVVVIEDDNIIRKGIITILQRIDDEINVVGEASDGESGMELIIKENPDIIITDIKMPIINGVEMITHLKNMNIKGKFLVLSGFDDYEYVRNVMKNGACDYLLKPINKVELKASLDQIKNLIKNEHKDEHKIFQDKSNQAIKNILDGFNKDVFEVIREKNYCVLIIENTNINFLYENKKQDISDIQEFINLYCDNKKISYCYNLCENHILLIISFKNDTHKLLFCKELSNSIKLRYPSIYISVSSLGKGIGNINDLYQQANKMSLYKIYNSEDCISFFENFSLLNNSSIKKLQYNINILYQNIIGFTDVCDREKCINEINMMLDLLYNYMVNSKQIIKVLEKMFSKIDHTVLELNDYENKFNINISKLVLAKDLKEYKNFVAYLINERINFIEFFKSEHDKKIIDKAKQYVQENYSFQITLTDVANYVNLSPNYFSEVFKNETGQTFIKYLITYRCQKAKELLKNTDLKIYEVAEMVGYKEVVSFNRAFKNTIGISPKQYTNNIK